MHCRHTRQDNQGRFGFSSELRPILLFTCLKFSLITVFYRASDLYMKGIQNAKERDATAWEQLFESVESRFKIVEIKSPKGAFLSLISVIWGERVKITYTLR